jgi:hypothetical protein
MATRLLKQDETDLARKVFQDKLPYGKIYIANFFLPGNTNVPVTLAGGLNPVPLTFRIVFTIYWGEVIYNGSAAQIDPVTLIHELTHVWQGHHDKNVLSYMAESAISQGKAIWHTGDRNNAYHYDKSKYHNWSDYNVEQQANIVEDWFNPGEGNQSTSDPRYPYIANNIRAGNQSATYSPPAAAAAPTLPAGAWADIKEAQEALFNLGYLTDRKYIDGFMGTITRKALWKFQERNGLVPPDGILGPKTRSKLKQPLNTLKRAP